MCGFFIKKYSANKNLTFLYQLKSIMNIEKHPQQKYFDKIILYMLYTLLDANMEGTE